MVSEKHRSWRRNFSPEIIKRAEEYVEKGRVGGLKEKIPKNYEVIVHGSQNYRVSLVIDKNNIVRCTYCSCPHFDAGYNCKHIAAVLLKRERELTGESEVIEVDDNSITSLSHEIARIRRSYIKRGSYIEYWEAMRFVDEIINFIEEHCQRFLRTKRIDEAFELSKIATLKFMKTDMDDDGGVTRFEIAIDQIWCDIYAIAEPELKVTMFNWIKTELGKDHKKYFCSGEPLEELLKNFWSMHFNTKEFFERKLKYIDRQIVKMTEIEDDFSKEYHTVDWLLMKSELLAKSGAVSSEELERFYEDNWQYDALRQEYVAWTIERKEYDKALYLIWKILETEDVDDKSRIVYYCKLNHIYAMTDNVEMRKECLRELIRSDYHPQENYMSLKNLYLPDAWLAARKSIIASMADGTLRAYYYNREKMFEELRNEVASDQSGYLLQKYDKTLAKFDCDFTLEAYEKILRMKVESWTPDRKLYRELARLLRKLGRLPRGEKRAQKIIGEWREKYKKRWAMMEEIDRVSSELDY